MMGWYTEFAKPSKSKKPKFNGSTYIKKRS